MKLVNVKLVKLLKKHIQNEQTQKKKEKKIITHKNSHVPPKHHG